ncbi:MAG: N-acetylneuraminate synthase family protein, partial [Bacteroidia bacterium]|nr:N-acetylneuraminate synthase family protein [Bacteroidia bacterium]
MNLISIADRKIGPGFPCFIIAEAGVNHNGDPALARELIVAAAEAGADAVKFQTFKAEKLVTKSAKMADYQVQNTGQESSQLDMLRKLELQYDAHRELKDFAESLGLIFLSTPFDLEGI